MTSWSPRPTASSTAPTRRGGPACCRRSASSSPGWRRRPRAVRRPAIEAVNVAAMVPSLCAVDAAGAALTPGLLYGDARAAHDRRPRPVAERRAGRLPRLVRRRGARRRRLLARAGGGQPRPRRRGGDRHGDGHDRAAAVRPDRLGPGGGRGRRHDGRPPAADRPRRRGRGPSGRRAARRRRPARGRHGRRLRRAAGGRGGRGRRRAGHLRHHAHHVGGAARMARGRRACGPCRTAPPARRSSAGPATPVACSSSGWCA